MTTPLTVTPSFCSTNRAHPAFATLAEHFACALGRACDAHDACFGTRITDALREAAPLIDLLSKAELEGSAQRYTRHVLASDAAGRFAAAALIWRPGQCTPVHGHHTWCGYRVIKGALTEEWFEWDEAILRATHRGTRRREAGATSFVGAGTGGIHRLANHSDALAVSLHVYGVHADDIATHVNQLVACDAPFTTA